MRKLALLICLGTSACLVYGQQNVSFREGSIVSPQVNEDRSVTFRIRAPHAGDVRVQGDWAAGNGLGVMKMDADSVWTYTTPELPSEMYTYRIVIDGVAGLDPTNPFTKRDVGFVSSVFFVNGGCADYYQVHDVPHGSVSTVWYPSEQLGMSRRMSVYTPPAYGQEKDKAYPVLYLLHGSGGDETAWVELGNVARIMDNFPAYDVSMTETHHIHKLDAPSGTAITLAEDIIHTIDRKKVWKLAEAPLPARELACPSGVSPLPTGEEPGERLQGSTALLITSVRKGEVPGIHSIRYDSEADSITITHDAKNRSGFALGAVLAAEYTATHTGFLGMSDLFPFLHE